MTITSLIGFAGALNALLLAVVAAVAARRDHRAGWLAATFAIVSLAVSAILVSHATEGQTQMVAVVVEQTVTLAAGPAFYHYFLAALGQRSSRRTFLLFLPSIAYAVAAPPLVLVWLYDPLSSLWLVTWQAGFTLAAAVLFVRRRQPRNRTAHGFIWPTALLLMMGAIHGAQATRLLGVAGGNDRDVVAMIAALCACGLLILALSAAKFVERTQRYEKSALSLEHLRTIFTRADEVVRRERLYRRYDLALADVAAAAGVPAKHLTQALSEAGSSAFNAWIAGLRAEEAARLLAEPDLATAAVEALGLEAGFRSRSAFYTTFQKRFGCTPAEHRRRIMSSPRGQDMKASAGDRKPT